jgi:integrase
LRIATEKTGENVSIRVSDALDAALSAGPIGPETFVTGDRGGPLTKGVLGAQFLEWTKAAGLSHRTAHGLRKTAATSDAHDGWSESELDAKFGWRGERLHGGREPRAPLTPGRRAP